MKKCFTIIMAVLCICAFSVNNADAKTKKRINGSSKIKYVYCKLEGDLSGYGIEYRTLVINANKGYFVDSNGIKNKIRVIKISGDYMEIAVSDNPRDLGSEEHGWMYGKLYGQISGTISGNKAYLDSFCGKFSHWYGYDSDFNLLDYTGD